MAVTQFYVVTCCIINAFKSPVLIVTERTQHAMPQHLFLQPHPHHRFRRILPPASRPRLAPPQSCVFGLQGVHYKAEQAIATKHRDKSMTPDFCKSDKTQRDATFAGLSGLRRLRKSAFSLMCASTRRQGPFRAGIGSISCRLTSATPDLMPLTYLCGPASVRPYASSHQWRKPSDTCCALAALRASETGLYVNDVISAWRLMERRTDGRSTVVWWKMG